MKKLLLIVTSTLLITSNAFAGSWGVGAAGHIASVSADGTETTPTDTGTENSVKSATAGNDVLFGSICAEYSFGDGEIFTFGVDYVPGSADVNRETLSRTDARSDSNEDNDQSGKNSANAELSDHVTYYAEIGGMNSLYGKLGFAQVDVKTKDTRAASGTVGTYPDKTLDAWTYGLGYKGEFGTNGYFKVEGYYTNYDDFSATSTTSNTVKASLDVVGAALRVGYKF